MHLGLLCPPIPGHLNPMTTLGRELQRRGHRVTFFSLPDGESRVQSAGLEFVPFGAEVCPPGWTSENVAKLGELSGPAALEFTLSLYRRMNAALFRDAVSVCRDAGFDALLLDQTNLGSHSVAEKLGLPYVGVCNALPLNGEPGVPPWDTTWPYATGPVALFRNTTGYLLRYKFASPWMEDINAGRRNLGLPELTPKTAYGEPRVTVAQIPASLDFPRKELPTHFRYTGPWHEPVATEDPSFAWDRLDGQPLIYASLGTLQNRLLPVFQTIAAAVAPLNAQLVVALGRPDAEIPTDWPGNPIVVGYAPQRELVARASLVVTHAGLNTVLETLTHGVPIVALPIANDQPGIASRIRHHEVGDWLDIGKLTVEGLREAINRVLTDPKYRRNAEIQRAKIQEANGLKTAADLIESALATG